MVTLIVEDGTGVANANTFASEATADIYWTDHGAPADWTGASSDVKTQALVAGAQYLLTLFWLGTKTLSTQSLSHPRIGVRDDGFTISSIVIPQRVIDAQIILGLKHIQDGSLYSDTAANAGNLSKTKSKIGDLEESFEYIGSANSQKRYAEVNQLIMPFLTSGSEVIRG